MYDAGRLHRCYGKDSPWHNSVKIRGSTDEWTVHMMWPGNFSLPLTQALVLMCVCMRKQVPVSLNLWSKMYWKRTVSCNNRGQKTKASRQFFSWADRSSHSRLFTASVESDVVCNTTFGWTVDRLRSRARLELWLPRKQKASQSLIPLCQYYTEKFLWKPKRQEALESWKRLLKKTQQPSIYVCDFREDLPYSLHPPSEQTNHWAAPNHITASLFLPKWPECLASVRMREREKKKHCL